ncbi:hypothetical protein H5P28_05010 [Ruficoccus amylovorans]|uniref:Uncharacterized protein n=1 Tax=Ruficoccus amylovorans TaxID=1804625 RepID=A0A842HDF1_9BACT|nr:hypothetical protein [Ruficoccus amylovorans]MBC2593617.1 hypothetical protein [Ruficoccus amylovorans]
MSLDSFLQNLRSLAEFILKVPYGTGAFYLLLGVVLFSLLIVGKLMSSAFGGGSRGFVPVFLSQVIVVVLALACAALTQTLLAPQVNSVPLLHGSIIAAAAIGGVIGVLMTSRLLLGVVPGVGIVITLLTLALSYGVLWGAEKLLHSVGQSEQIIEQYQARVAE